MTTHRLAAATLLASLAATATATAAATVAGCQGAIVEAGDGDGDGDGPGSPDASVAPGVDAAPLPADCRAALDALGVTWTDATARDGVATPVDVTLPIGGIGFRTVGGASPRTTFFMDCELARALALAAPIFAARGVVEVQDYGVYNYRCIDQSVQPPCPGSSLSQHAYATAIDIAVLTTTDGTTYSVNDDWVIDPDAEETCAAPTENTKDTFLHETLCALRAADVFRIYLTPNYNAAHRNHWHVDLTPGGNFLEKPGARPGAARPADHHDHDHDHADHGAALLDE